MSKYLIIDSREKAKAIKNIIKTFDDAGVQYETSKLLFGDYMDYSRPNLVIDRKQTIAELAKNCTTDAERFRRELERVNKTGSELVILVEQNRYKDRDKWITVEQISDLIMWTNPHSKIRGEKVFRVLSSWVARYNLRIEFCSKTQTGKKILSILYPGTEFTKKQNENNDGRK